MKNLDLVADSYNTVLDRVTKITGYTWEYFSSRKLREIKRILGENYSGSILDYGCGPGNLIKFLKLNFPKATITGCDELESMLLLCRCNYPDILFVYPFQALQFKYDVIIVSNVLHHIDYEWRADSIRILMNRLRSNGRLIVIEHNPYNPFVRWNVDHSPLDLGVKLVWPKFVLSVFQKLSDVKMRYIVVLPKWLSWFNCLELILNRIPFIGIQYIVWGQK